MSTTQIVIAAGGAVLLFWIVGAYNRLVRLRNDLVGRFAPVDEQLQARHALLLQQIDALAAVLQNAAPRLDALRAACEQADVARAQARSGAPGAITSLRLAEEILAEARARLPIKAAPGVDLPELNAQLAASDTTLAFARRQFNDAVNDYNQALRQIPTTMVARAVQLPHRRRVLSATALARRLRPDEIARAACSPVSQWPAPRSRHPGTPPRRAPRRCASRASPPPARNATAPTVMPRPDRRCPVWPGCRPPSCCGRCRRFATARGRRP